MIILYKDSDTRPEIRSIVLIFGVGLIGKEIVHSLLSHEQYKSQSYDFHWNDRKQQAADAENLITQFRNIAHAGTRESARPKKLMLHLYGQRAKPALPHRTRKWKKRKYLST